MLQKLQIRNFRIHKKQDIIFDTNITSIIGSSFSGKSTIIQSLKWVMRNMPSGDSIINWDSDKTSVRLITDKSKIIRSKGKGINLYKLDDSEYKAFGNEVPVDIAKELNISDINFQSQFSSHFWFSETAGEVSRQLNQIVNLEVIDTTLANIASELRKSRSTIDVIQTRLSNIEIEKKELDYIEELDEDLKSIESIENKYQKNAIECSTIDELLKSVRLYRLNQNNALELMSDSKLAISKGSLYQEISEKADILCQSIKNGRIYEKESSIKIPSLKRLEELNNKIQDIKNQKDILNNLFGKAEQLEEVIFQETEDLKKYKKEFDNSIGKVCPLCNQKIMKK